MRMKASLVLRGRWPDSSVLRGEYPVIYQSRANTLAALLLIAATSVRNEVEEMSSLTWFNDKRA